MKRINTTAPANPATHSRRKTYMLSGILVLLHASAVSVSGQTIARENAAGTASKEDPITLSAFEVKEDSDVGYRATQTLSALGTAQLLRDVPSSISVLNRNLIEDLNVTDVNELSMYNISGEVAENNESPISSGGGGTRSRGTVTQTLRDGMVFWVASDSYNVDRVELLRGPNGFLYTGAGAGGVSNIVTKRAERRRISTLALIFGSKNLARAEFDYNTPLNDKLAARVNVAYQRGGGFQNHTSRRFRAAHLAVNYRPFPSTNINLAAELGENVSIMASNILADQFSTTERNGTRGTFSATTGGFTHVPARGIIFDSVGTLRSTGPNLLIPHQDIFSDETNMQGPGAYNLTEHHAYSLSIDQKVGSNLNLQFLGILHGGEREIGRKLGASVAGVYKDINPTLPNGTPNPYFGEYFTEFYHAIHTYPEPFENVRVKAVYDLDLRFTKQRILAGYHYQSSDPVAEIFSEYVDPLSPRFKGQLINANTLEAYRSNITVLNQNRVSRRFYFRDGDNEDITERGAMPGETLMMRDISSDGTSGRSIKRYQWNSGSMAGASGSYFKERLHTMVGWRTDSFNQAPERDFYNVVSGETYRLANVTQPQVRRRGQSVTYGGVFHLAKFLALSATYAETSELNSPGGTGLLLGPAQGLNHGFGEDYSMRWQFLDGALESNWTYYKNFRRASATVAGTISQELLLLVDDLYSGGGDTQVSDASGIEFDTIANVNRSWRLLWNFSSNKLKTSERYPQLKEVKEMANSAGHATPVTDAFLMSVPDGTPIAGFTKIRSNLVTSYRFESGSLKGVSAGGGVQYREESFQGNFDRNGDGIAEELWTPGYVITNLTFGYRTQLWNRPINVGLNINNLLNKRYYRAASLSTGAVGSGREFRLSVRANL